MRWSAATQADPNVQTIASSDIARLKRGCYSVWQYFSPPQAIVNSHFSSFGVRLRANQDAHVALAHNDPAILLGPEDVMCADAGAGVE